jgi:hypothetical protein
LVSFLGISIGLIADVDIGSEHLRLVVLVACQRRFMQKSALLGSMLSLILLAIFEKLASFLKLNVIILFLHFSQKTLIFRPKYFKIKALVPGGRS